jgi:hypothetical protein
LSNKWSSSKTKRDGAGCLQEASSRKGITHCHQS